MISFGRIDEAQIEACRAFARSVAKDAGQVELLANALNVTRLKTAKAIGDTLDESAIRAYAGQISLCNWFENVMREACEEQEANAKAEGSPQFLSGAFPAGGDRPADFPGGTPSKAAPTPEWHRA